MCEGKISFWPAHDWSMSSHCFVLGGVNSHRKVSYRTWSFTSVGMCLRRNDSWRVVILQEAERGIKSPTWLLPKALCIHVHTESGILHDSLWWHSAEWTCRYKICNLDLVCICLTVRLNDLQDLISDNTSSEILYYLAYHRRLTEYVSDVHDFYFSMLIMKNNEQSNRILSIICDKGLQYIVELNQFIWNNEHVFSKQLQEWTQ